MLDQILLFTLSIVMTIASIALALIAWKRGRRSYRKPLALLMMAEVVIVWFYMMVVSSATLSDKLLWNSIEYLGYMAATPLFFTFAIQYAWNKRCSYVCAVVLFAPAVLFYLALLTNDYHHLFYVSTSLSPDSYRSIQAVYGPVFYLFMSYSALLLLGGLIVLIHHYLKTSKAHKVGVGITVLAFGVAVGTVFANFAILYTIGGTLVVVVGLLASNLLLFIGAYGFELFSMVPFALERVLGSMKDGVIIVDDRDHILFQNVAASTMMGTADVYGQDIRKLLPGLHYDALIQEGIEDREEHHEVLPQRFFEVQIKPVLNHDENIIGRGIYLREVTAQLTAQADAKLAKDKLELLNSITRHDINNQLTVLEGHLALATMKAGTGEIAKHISASARAASTVREQIKFARDYQELGMRAPVWHDVAETFRGHAARLGTSNIIMELDTGGVLVNADPMLEKVFYNLIDNSLVHGEKVSRILVTTEEVPGGLAIIYEDDGVGIPADLKERLFTKGGGRRSGLAMYLSKEILAYGGMGIREEGSPGKGARFVITVPPGKFRFPVQSERKMPSGHNGTVPSSSAP